MRILITNDDGIHAPGLEVLERIAAKLSDDVYVVAPEYDQSGVAHSLSLNDPLRLRKISERHANGLHHHGRALDPRIEAARSHSVRRQSRP
jgi:5'/3'-nucleotidase SurE